MANSKSRRRVSTKKPYKKGRRERSPARRRSKSPSPTRKRRKYARRSTSSERRSDSSVSDESSSSGPVRSASSSPEPVVSSRSHRHRRRTPSPARRSYSPRARRSTSSTSRQPVHLPAPPPYSPVRQVSTGCGQCHLLEPLFREIEKNPQFMNKAITSIKQVDSMQRVMGPVIGELRKRGEIPTRGAHKYITQKRKTVEGPGLTGLPPPVKPKIVVKLKPTNQQEKAVDPPTKPGKREVDVIYVSDDEQATSSQKPAADEPKSLDFANESVEESDVAYDE